MTNTYILVSGETVAVIDPAFEPERILSVVTKDERRLKYIINTHGHIDHISANSVIREKTGAKILIHELDAPLLSQPAKNLSLLIGESLTNCQSDVLLKEGDYITIGEFKLKVLHTPGHTDGSICLQGDDFIFTGDTLFFDSIGRTDLPGGSEEKIFASLKRLSSLLKEDMLIYPGHGAVAKFKEVKRVNPFLTP